MNQPNHALPRAGKPIFSQTKIELETEKRRQLKNIYQAEEPVAVGWDHIVVKVCLKPHLNSFYKYAASKSF